MPGYDRRDVLRFAASAAGAGVLTAGCSDATLGGDEGATDGPVKVGLLLPESGVFKALADDQRSGWDLYLRANGGKLGGREVRVVTADEGDGQKTETARAAVERLLEREKCLVVCGIISSANLIAVQPMFSEAKVPLLCTNAGAVQMLGKKYLWRSSFVNGQAGRALGEYVAREADGKVATIAWDYAAGHDFVNGFLKTFKPAGGEVAGEPIFTPFPMRGTFQPYLQQIEQRNPKAVYAFFAGADAVKFVKEYEKFGLADKYQLYAPGDLTEGGVLAAQGAAAEGIMTAMHYAPDLDNQANRSFVAKYQKRRGRLPTIFSVAAYDAGWILDKAIAAAGADLTSEALEKAIGEVGEVDSPRGSWMFGKNRSPVQRFYLREVREDGDVLANVVVDELATLGDSV